MAALLAPRPRGARRLAALALAALALTSLAACSSTDLAQESCTKVCDYRRHCLGSTADAATCVGVCERWITGGASGAGGAGGESGAGGASGTGGQSGAGGEGGAGGAGGGTAGATGAAGGTAGAAEAAGGTAGAAPESEKARLLRVRRCAACVDDRPCSTSGRLCGDECEGIPAD